MISKTLNPRKCSKNFFCALLDYLKPRGNLFRARSCGLRRRARERRYRYGHRKKKFGALERRSATPTSTTTHPLPLTLISLNLVCKIPQPWGRENWVPWKRSKPTCKYNALSVTGASEDCASCPLLRTAKISKVADFLSFLRPTGRIYSIRYEGIRSKLHGESTICRAFFLSS